MTEERRQEFDSDCSIPSFLRSYPNRFGYFFHENLAIAVFTGVRIRDNCLYDFFRQVVYGDNFHPRADR